MPDPADILMESLTPSIGRATVGINSRIEAAAACAERSLTRAVLEAQDGRQTWRAIATQRSALAAQSRLDDLMEWLVGPTNRSTDGLIADARSRFYRDAFPHWAIRLPAAIRVPGAGPTTAGDKKARGLILSGKSPRQEIAPIFLAASGSLQTAINAAAVATLPAKQRHAIIDDWEKKTAAAIRQKVETMLSNSQVAITTMVGANMVKKELRKGKA